MFCRRLQYIESVSTWYDLSRFQGYHSCLIAYGSPGTGKSHSLYGKASSGKYKGMIIRAAEALINAVDKTSANQKTDISMSFVQLYNEKFYDILVTVFFTLCNFNRGLVMFRHLLRAMRFRKY